MSSADRALVADRIRLDAIESVIVDAVRAGGPDRTVAVVVVDAGSPLAAFGRAIEAHRFPEYDMAKVMEPFEAASLFLYTVDVEHGRIGHVKRLVRGNTAEQLAATGRTGIGTLHSSILPAGTLYHSSRRLRRDSTRAVKVGVSLRRTSRFVRSAAGTSAATRTALIGTRCSGFS